MIAVERLVFPRLLMMLLLSGEPGPPAVLASAGTVPGNQTPVSYQLKQISRETQYFQKSFDARQIALLEKLNRSDRDHLPDLGMILIPDRWDLPEIAYTPLPTFYKPTREYQQILLVDLPAQVFGAYEKGLLVRWGPISSGQAEFLTPSGFFHLNWKARNHRSTEDPDWQMRWYFNFHNERGLSFHTFSLPGWPASHACVRLLERDAKWLFDWGEQWELDEKGWTVLDHGTPIVILGQYDFGSPPSWLSDRAPRAIVLPLKLPK